MLILFKILFEEVVSGAIEILATTLIEWAMSELLRNLRAMGKVQAEVRRVFEGKRNIEKLDYFKLVVTETLVSILKEQNLNIFLLEVVRGYVQAYHLL